MEFKNFKMNTLPEFVREFCEDKIMINNSKNPGFLKHESLENRNRLFQIISG